MKTPKIIYFLADSIPTEAEQAEAESFGVKVMWRNVNYIDPEAFPELCDGVAGLVPPSYEAFPSATDALEGYVSEIEKRRGLMGDEMAPETPVARTKGKKQVAYADIKPAQAEPVVQTQPSDDVKSTLPVAAAGWSAGK